MNDIAQLISTVGFPIVMTLLMFFKFDKAIETLTQAVNNNTSTLNILLEKERNEA